MKPTPLVRTAIAWTSLVIASVVTRLPAADSPVVGTIEGRVLNSAKGEYIGNARVTVEGTRLEAFTQSDGSYRLTNVPAGNASVRAFFTGMPLQTTSVRVAGGQVVQVDIDLAGANSDTVVKLSQFVVSTTRDMDGAAIAINEQRFAPNVKTVVSTDEFGDVAEGSLGEFMKFVPGVSIEYTAGALARGISINGAEGFIFDLLQLVDLDGDGDLDVITQEEKGPYLAAGYVGKELGVVWYENPARASGAAPTQ